MNSVLGLCLCLVLIGLTTAGAIVYTNRSYSGGMLPDVQVCKAEPLVLNDVDSAPAAIGGNKPVIQVFKAAPMVLDAPDSAAVYTFKVKHATNVQINEAGTNIRDISNPSGATLQGNVTGLPASAIPTDDSGKFITFLIASNDDGSVKAELTLSLAQNLLPTGPPAGQSGETGNQTEPRSPKWLAQVFTPRTTTPSTPTTANKPEFLKCPDGCPYCLTPEDAAGRGFTQKCSDERCYYSPDEKQNWWCYSEPVGYCCKDSKVMEATKSKCAQVGGYWSTNQNEAIQACQPVGWCCARGQVGQTTQSQCAQVGGAWYTNRVEAMRACQPVGWCCAGGQVGQTTQSQCAQVGGTYYTNQAQAIESCRQPATCWCCAGGKVYQTTQAQCAQTGGTCYSTQSQATAGCRQAAMCWCCSGGKVSYTTQAACAQVGGACYSTESQATAGCRLTTPTYR
jgi:hypothetical protein